MIKENKEVKVQLSKAAVGNEKTVTAIVTSPSMDRDYDEVDTATLRLPLKGGGTIQARNLTGNEELDVPFLINHAMNVTDVIGSARSAKMTQDSELEMVFGLSSLEKAQDMYTLLNEGHLDNAFSITFHDYDLQNGVMYDAEVLEVSLVWRGSNPDARLVAVSKSLKAETKENNKETETKDVTDDTAVEVEDKKDNKMNKNEETVVETVVEKTVAEQPKKVAKVSKNEIRKNFVAQLRSVFNKDEAGLMKAAKNGAELENVESKVLDGAHIYLSEVVSNDIKAAYVDAGGVGALVNRIDVTGADIFKQVVETSGVGFQPTALGSAKSEDAPVWGQVDIEPLEWALIVVWRDGQAARSPIAVYQQIVRYIADQYRKLEDNIILSYAGGTVGSETRDATGLVPLLVAANRDSTVPTSYGSQNLIPALGAAFAAVQSDAPLSLVANRNTWAKIATSLDGEYNPVFKVVGKELTAGALGTFTVVTSEALDDGEIVIGAMRDYTLVTRGDLSTLFSQEATVGSTNLFTQNASGLRASIDIAGAATPVTSFWLLTGVDYVVS